MPHPLDLEVYAHHVRFMEQIADTEPPNSRLKPGARRTPKSARFGGDLEKAKDFIKDTMIAGWHPCGTCAMRPRDEGGGGGSTIEGVWNMESASGGCKHHATDMSRQ